ncbi:RNA polymerase sigma factor [Streptomyces sp. NPDC059757]|uniref:RNA polymerase sigma factor n=1 Tax=Streptomyces sp. NPDC059757 TaxID=3346935 RepID=UPI003662C585
MTLVEEVTGSASEPGADPAMAEALAALFAESGQEMVGYARNRLAQLEVPQSEADPEDIVQEAFKNALMTPTAIRIPRRYMYQVIRNEVRAVVRCRAAHRRLETERVADPTRFDADQSPDIAQLAANRAVVIQYLADRPPQQRTAVWATKALGMKNGEAAAAMGVSPNTVGVHVMRAVRVLRGQLTAVICVLLVVVATAEAARQVRRVRPSSPVAPEPAPVGDAVLWQVLVGVLIVLALGALLAWLVPMEGLQSFAGGVFRLVEDKPGMPVGHKQAPRPQTRQSSSSSRLVRGAEAFFDNSQK